MPEHPLTIATYAAGASLAAITLVYVFGPTFFLDDDAANSSKSSRKKGVVGLVNPANDCFINSVLQALAGLPQLRTYLIREVHRRSLDGPEMYQSLTAAIEEERKNENSKKSPGWKIVGLQQGLVTAGLKDVLDALNERPIYKKTISAQSFIRVVEQAFRTRINRSQQDAQEFLQLIVERLAEEYRAGNRVRSAVTQNEGETQESLSDIDAKAMIASRQNEESGESDSSSPSAKVLSTEAPAVQTTEAASLDHTSNEQENAFPMEGKLESQVECSHCHFKPKPSASSFLTLTLNVPHNETSTTLNNCFDGMFKVEHIDDFTCDRCRLEHALKVNATKLAKTSFSPKDRAALEVERDKIEAAFREDPENPPKDVTLPDLSTAPKRRISRHMRISAFPQILAVHLSRSIWDPHAISSKNMAKVSFPEELPLGGLLDRKNYRLLGVVTHKGGHHSGHYESFRRQVLTPPFSTHASMGTEGVYSIKNTPMPSPRPSVASSPHLGGTDTNEASESASDPQSPTSHTQSLSRSVSETPSMSSASSRSLRLPSRFDKRKPPADSVPLDAIPIPGLPSLPSEKQSLSPTVPDTAPKTQTGIGMLKGKAPKRKQNERWWRISDDKIKESKTSEVLAMQREVYLLFYEIVADQA